VVTHIVIDIFDFILCLGLCLNEVRIVTLRKHFWAGQFVLVGIHLLLLRLHRLQLGSKEVMRFTLSNKLMVRLLLFS